MQAGTVLRDKYQLVATIGRGGMGEVFHAIHLPSGTDVAIKVVNREIVDEMMMARLEREAAAATRIQSPFVPRVLDVDRLDSGELFLVMELLHGETFSERLKRGGVLSWEEVFHIGDNVLRGLIDAHEAGVVHRDLKPGNVFIEHLDGGMARARVLDFGVCKLDEQDTKKLTITGESVGTISYMAPEQIRGASKVDERADLYSFGMIVYEALCGRLPYDAQGQMALLATKLERPARGLRGYHLVAVPPGLDNLLTRALSRKPTDRPANAREMLRAWQGLGAATAQPTAQPAASASAPTSSSPPTQVAVTAGVRSTLSGRRKPALAVGVLLALGVGIVLVTAAARRSPAAPPDGDALIAPAAAEAPRPPGARDPSAPTATPTAVDTGGSSTALALGPVLPSAASAAPAPLVELDDAAARAQANAAGTTGASSLPTPATTSGSRHSAASSMPSPRPSGKASPPVVPSTAPRKPTGPTLVEQPRY